MSTGWKSRIVRIKIAVKELADAIFKKPLTFNEKDLIRQLELIDAGDFVLEEEGPFYKVKKETEIFWLRKNSSDLSVFEQIFFKEEYKPLIAVVSLNTINVNTIVDIGSNIGLASRYFSRYFPKASYICVEPDKGNFAVLKMNIGAMPDVRPYEYAIWNNQKQLGMNTGFRDGQGWSLSVSEDLDASFASVPAITIDQLFSDNNLTEIDLLKIDIEGAEFVVFEKLSDVDFLKKVKVIAIEIHEDVGPKARIIEKLLHFDFFLYEYSETVIGINTKLVGQ